MKKIVLSLAVMLCGFSLTNCQKEANSTPKRTSYDLNNEFGDYWYAGVAEISSYNLEQVRYGEVHNGKAVLIFVTEPFSKSKQVKLDYPKQNPEDEQTVLKLNFTKKFNTGIYPYSMMLSSFTPVQLNEYPNTPKVTMSSQEWCGHVFSQMNLNKKGYDLASYSYFEKEGDVEKTIEIGLLEDEIWNKIRLNYSSLPVGEIKLIPGLFHTRLLHKNLKNKTAHAQLIEEADEIMYSLEYKDDGRRLSISFEKEFPHRILEWEESTTSRGGKVLTTKATLDKTILTDYWSKNKVADSYLRDSLNLN